MSLNRRRATGAQAEVVSADAPVCDLLYEGRDHESALGLATEFHNDVVAAKRVGEKR